MWYIPPYTDEEFKEIALKGLTKEERISAGFATNITEQVIRRLNRKDRIKIARIARKYKRDSIGIAEPVF